MRKPSDGTEQPKAFVIETGASWKRWANHRNDSELEEINQCLQQLLATFGKPHGHAGLGLRHLLQNAFEFRISRGLRVVFYS